MIEPPKTTRTAANRTMVPPLPRTSGERQLVIGVICFVIALLLLLFLFLFFATQRSGSAAVGERPTKRATDKSNEMESGNGQLQTEVTEPNASQTAPHTVKIPATVPITNETTRGAVPKESLMDVPSVSGNSRSPLASEPTEDIPVVTTNKEDTVPMELPAGTISVGNISGTAEFFGITSDRGSIAFVIDQSSSMSGGKFGRARSELKKSVYGLGSSQAFNVFLFNDSYTVFSEELIKATDSEGAEFEAWIDKIRPYGGTRPLPAVQAAVDSGISTIYLLSDGEFSDAEARRIIQLCTAREIQVHCISLNATSHTMREISSQCQGQYRFVPSY